MHRGAIKSFARLYYYASYIRNVETTIINFRNEIINLFNLFILLSGRELNYYGLSKIFK